MNVSANVDTTQLKKQLKKASTMGTPRQREAVLKGALFIIIDKAVSNLRQLELWITGTLAGAITSETRINGNKVEGRVGTNLIYARIHELGGIIKPKKGKFLWFETTVDKLKKKPKKPPKNNKVLIKVKQVEIPARPYLRPAFIETLPEVVNKINDDLEAILANSIK